MLPEVATQGLTLRPPLARWAPRPRGPGYLGTADATRRALGLPLDRPVVMSGHQPVLWHAGIFAKYAAAGVFASRVGAAAAWLVVDLDAVDPGEFRYPARSPSGAGGVLPGTGRLLAHVARLTREPADPARPAAAYDVFSPPGVLDPPAWEGVAREASSALRVLGEAGRGARNAAEQVARAYAPLVEGTCPPLPPVYSSALSATPAFGALLERMTADPGGCIRAHNAAAAAFPGAKVRPLDEAAGELPLWRLTGEGASLRRASVRATDVRGAPVHTLAPKALLLTALLRLSACDLFIHGTGGEAYDRVTDRWMRDWLGPEAVLAPTVMATADMYLPLPPAARPTLKELNVLSQRARRVMHDPGVLGDADGQGRVRDLAAVIAALPRRSPERRERFAQLHRALDDYRSRRAGEIGSWRERAEAERRAAVADVSRDRGWPFFLHGREALRALAASIGA